MFRKMAINNSQLSQFHSRHSKVTQPKIKLFPLNSDKPITKTQLFEDNKTKKQLNINGIFHNKIQRIRKRKRSQAHQQLDHQLEQNQITYFEYMKAKFNLFEEQWGEYPIFYFSKMNRMLGQHFGDGFIKQDEYLKFKKELFQKQFEKQLLSEKEYQEKITDLDYEVVDAPVFFKS